MKVKFPANCNNESSRWSFSVKLNEKLRLWHNGECSGKTASEAEAWRKANFYPRLNAVMVARNEQIEISRVGGHWNPKIPDHVSGGTINYPSGLDQNNEGSRASFLFGLVDRLKNKPPDDVDVVAAQNALSRAKQDATVGTFWNPTLGVIING